MRTLRLLLVALLGVTMLSLAGSASAQMVDDPAACPADPGSFCADCIRLGGVWNQDRAAAGQCGGIFCCDAMPTAPAPAPAPAPAVQPAPAAPPTAPASAAPAPSAPRPTAPAATPVPAKPTYTG